MGWVIFWATGVIPAFVLITRRWREESNVTGFDLIVFLLLSLIASWITILIMAIYAMTNVIVFKRKNKN